MVKTSVAWNSSAEGCLGIGGMKGGGVSEEGGVIGGGGGMFGEIGRTGPRKRNATLITRQHPQGGGGREALSIHFGFL